MKVKDIIKFKNLGKTFLHENGECKLIYDKGLKLVSITMDETRDIALIYPVEYLQTADFCEMVDWRKVRTDTRILIKEPGEKEWKYAWFAFHVYNEPFVWEGEDYYEVIRDVKRARRVRMAKLVE